MDQIKLFQPLIEKNEIDTTFKALKIVCLGIGSFLKEFENQIAKIFNFPKKTDSYINAFSTFHGEFHSSLLIMEVGQIDEVFTSKETLKM